VARHRPLRGERESAATTRYVGCFVLPIRMSRSFTATVHTSFVSGDRPVWSLVPPQFNPGKPPSSPIPGIENGGGLPVWGLVPLGVTRPPPPLPLPLAFFILRPSPGTLLMRFIIFCTSSNCLTRALTSPGCTPLPEPIRPRREPSM